MTMPTARQQARDKLEDLCTVFQAALETLDDENGAQLYIGAAERTARIQALLEKDVPGGMTVAAMDAFELGREFNEAESHFSTMAEEIKDMRFDRIAADCNQFSKTMLEVGRLLAH